MTMKKKSKDQEVTVFFAGMVIAGFVLVMICCVVMPILV